MSQTQTSLHQAESSEDINDARQLFEEYAAEIGISPCFQNFDEELASLPGKYSPPDGRLLLVQANEALAGCIALRKIDSTACEMKRLFVRPEFRKLGLGRKLVDVIIDEGRAVGYKQMRLETMPGRMDRAIALYRAIGFKDIVNENPVKDVKFMELDL